MRPHLKTLLIGIGIGLTLAGVLSGIYFGTRDHRLLHEAWDTSMENKQEIQKIEHWIRIVEENERKAQQGK